MPTAILIFAYINLSFCVAVAGRNRQFGFWGYFFFSLLVTPVVGLLALIGGTPSSRSR